MKAETYNFHKAASFKPYFQLATQTFCYKLVVSKPKLRWQQTLYNCFHRPSKLISMSKIDGVPQFMNSDNSLYSLFFVCCVIPADACLTQTIVNN